MSSQVKVIHLEIEGEHHYFGSPKAMFDIIGEARLGMKYTSFHSNISLKVGEVYKNRRRGYVIRVGILGQAKTNRNNRWRERLDEAAEAAATEALIEQASQMEQATVAPIESPAPAVPETPAPAAAEAPAPAPEAPAPAAPSATEAPAPAPSEAPSAAPEAPAQTATEAPAEPTRPARKKKEKGGEGPVQLTLF